MDANGDSNVKEEQKENDQKNLNDVFNTPNKYTDDMTMFIAWQNWCWMEYSWTLYRQILQEKLQIATLMNQVQQYQYQTHSQQQAQERNNTQQQQQRQNVNIEERISKCRIVDHPDALK